MEVGGSDIHGRNSIKEYMTSFGLLK